ncbi:hypothetical protein ACSSS7_002433 [Eimeria intestinalis]
MANLGAGQEHPTEEEAVDLAEGLSAGSQHEVAAASAAGLEGPYIQAEKIEPREKRRVPSRRLVLGALVAVALALVLATMMTKKLPSVGVPPPVEAPEGAKKEPPVEDETQQEPEKPPTIASPGGPEEEAEVVEEKSGVPPPVEAREGVKKEPQVVSEEPKEPKVGWELPAVGGNPEEPEMSYVLSFAEPRSVGTAGGPGDEPEVVVPTPGTPPPVEAPEKIKKEPQDAGEEGDELEIGRKPPGVEEKPEEPEGPPSVETPGGPEVEPELVVHTLETPPPVGAPEEIKKEPDVLWESLEEAKEGKKPPVVEEKPGEPEGLPPVKAPEGVEKDMQLIEKEREETEVGWGSQVEEESEDSDVEEEWDFDKALEEWDSSEESEGEEEQEEEIRCLLNDLKINMVNIVKWALQTRTDTPLSGSKAREVALEQHVVRNGLRYEILARFTRLTPEYDPRQTAIALAEGLPIFFQNCLLLEDEARTSPGAAVTGEDFGDEETGKLNVFITGQSLSASLLLASRPMSLVHCSVNLEELQAAESCIHEWEMQAADE